MNRTYMTKKLLTTCIALCLTALGAMAQTTTTASSSMEASPWAVRVPYNVGDEGKKFNFTTGMGGWSDIQFAYKQRNWVGIDNTNIVRLNFFGRNSTSTTLPTSLSTEQTSTGITFNFPDGNPGSHNGLDTDLNILAPTGVKNILLLCDMDMRVRLNASDWNNTNRVNYYVNDMALAVKYLEGKGYNVVSVAPFNEPDYNAIGNCGGTASVFNIVAAAMQKNETLRGRVCGPNTLNTDRAVEWYSTMKDNIDVINTHQLAGSFEHLTEFWDTGIKAGKQAAADEMHNVMEAMVVMNHGGEYGTWWGYDGVARAEFSRMTSKGGQLAYNEQPTKLAVAGVYQYDNDDNKAKAIIGTSERQAVATAFAFLSKGRLAYYDGYGPAYDYTQEVQGGASGDYQKPTQTNAERVINIYTGEDVPVEPANGKYKLVNKLSGKVLSPRDGSLFNAVRICQYTDGTVGNQTWNIQPVANTIGGDYSYHYITNTNTSSNTYHLDDLDWSLDEGQEVIAYPGGGSGCEQWHIRYVREGYYTIINRHSGLCLEVRDGSTTDGANVVQKMVNETDAQLWKLVPADHAVDATAPAVPTGLTATAQSGSVKLAWTANNDSDIYGYMVYRYNDIARIWECIGRKVQETAFLDNTCRKGKELRYRIKALDKSYNLSEASKEVTAQTATDGALIGQWAGTSLEDNSPNLLHAVANGTKHATDGGHEAISFDGNDDYVKLPYHVGDMQQMTFAAWVKGSSTDAWQRIFDFGNGEDEYLFLTPTNGSAMRFEIKKSGDIQGLNATTTLGTGTWKHVAVTIGANGVAIYINGVKNASSTDITLRPSDVVPTMSYLGRSQFDADPAFKGMMSDVRIYNYALSDNDIAGIYGEFKSPEGENEFAGRNYTFNAAALNVDGLPNKISGIEINPDGKEAAGATELCGILANSGWDIVGFSEDFNFHSYLVAAPASNYYNFGEHGGSISASAILGGADTDGLGFACSKHHTMSGGTRTPWGNYNGFTDQGADGLVTKGFRVYTVTFATGVAVDVYVLHMDAEDGEKDIAARKTQLSKLAEHIKKNHNNRPVIILGDTNCRYTRDELKTAFIDVINADSRFTIKDAWVEHMWGGKYPTYGAGAMMTGDYGMQKGEVVDKIFYINTTESNLTLKANSYLHDESVTVSDHKPVVVNFTVTDPNGTPLTDEEKENNWTLEESVAGNKKPKWEGEQVVSGTAYYLMNVGTGEYIKWGGAYLTEALTGNAGTPIKPIANGNVWNLQSSTIRDKYLGDGDWTYLDRPVSESNWYLEPVSGTSTQYRLKSSRGLYLTATTAEAHHPVKSEAYNEANENQKWVFLTDDRIRKEMTKATADYPFNFTALLKSADFDLIEYEDGWTNNWDGFDWSGGGTGNVTGNGPFKGACSGWNPDASTYVSYAYANSTSKTEMSQSLGELPNGTYNISFEGFYRSRYKPSGLFQSEKDETRSAVVSFGSTNIAIPQNKSTTIGSGVDVVGPLFRDGDTYLKSQQVTMNSSASVTLKVTKPATSSSARGAWICIDNFRLIYYGTGEAPTDPYKEYKDKVCAKVNETYPLVMALNAAGQAAYDITTVISRYNNNQITTSADAQAMCNLVDAAYANALAAHNAYNVKQAVANMEANGGDITGAIINPSFETGDLTGWTTAGGGSDVNVYPNSNGTYTTSGCDEDYLFNSYGGDNGHTAHVKQTIKGIPNGLYELKVKVTSFDDRYVYITGNSYHTKVATTNGKTQFHEATLYFLVEDGSATIGAVGGNKGGGSEFIHYWPEQGCFFKADDFRLKYICDVPHGRLKLALDEANNARLDAYGQATLDISSYQTKYNNKSLTGDGTAEVTAIYNALQNAAKAQRTVDADMTWAITNPNFETGDNTGWACETGNDTKVAPQENRTYTIAGTDGRYLFNTWDNGTAKALTQTVTGIPNGTYKLTAMVASDANQKINFTANGVTTSIATSSNGAGSGVFPAVECEVTNGTLAISVVGVNNVWYKCDDFRLTLLMPNELILNEGDKIVPEINDVEYSKITVNRTIKPNTWSTFVVPFDIPASFLAGWEVKELSGSTYDKENGHISLTFADATDGIKAGVPYMVRNTTMTENLTAISMEKVVVNTTAMESVSTDDVEFIGTYTNGYVPAGAFFISSNTFYRAADNSNTMKAFRAYLMPVTGEGKAALSISYRTDGETTAIDNTQLTNDNEPTVVAIYNLQGVRLDDMQEGVNILQMSDGSVVKVVIK